MACRRRESNPHGREDRGILSPLRLPFRHSGSPAPYREAGEKERGQPGKVIPALAHRCQLGDAPLESECYDWNPT